MVQFLFLNFCDPVCHITVYINDRNIWCSFFFVSEEHLIARRYKEYWYTTEDSLHILIFTSIWNSYRMMSLTTRARSRNEGDQYDDEWWIIWQWITSSMKFLPEITRLRDKSMIFTFFCNLSYYVYTIILVSGLLRLIHWEYFDIQYRYIWRY